MSHYDHTLVRLEHQGETVMWFAPGFRVSRVPNNNLRVSERTGRLPRIRDRKRLSFEIKIQGAFLHEDELSTAHRDALQTLTGLGEVTARDQINRVIAYILDVDKPAPFKLVDHTDVYDGGPKTFNEMKAGTYPGVAINRFEPSWDAGHEAQPWVLSVQVGDMEVAP